jgi:hypothetical protein
MMEGHERSVREVGVHSVAVFGQLDHILRERNLTLADLKRQIEERFDSVIDTAGLDALAGAETLDRANFALIGAITDTLGVTLDDLFAVQASPVRVPASPPASFLTERQAHRLHELLDQQGEHKLSADERRELEILVYDEDGRRLIDYYRRKQAQEQGISLEQVRREEAEHIEWAKKRPRQLHADPHHAQDLANRRRQRQPVPKP